MLWKVVIGVIAALFVYGALHRYRLLRGMWE